MKQTVRITNSDEMLRFDIDSQLLQVIQLALGETRHESYKVLKNAVNATAKYASSGLAKKAQESYTAKKGRIKKSMTIRKATISKPESTVLVSGTTLELRDFKTTAPKSGAKARVRADAALKLIQSNRGNRAKAFLTTFESGHTALVQRQEGEEYKRDKAKRRKKYGPHIDVTRIKKLLSISVPTMVGGSAVYEVLLPEIREKLLDNIILEIDKVLEK